MAFRVASGARALRALPRMMRVRTLPVVAPHLRAVAAAAVPTMRFAATQPAMFCMQCEQTEGGKGCSTVGVCGKTPEVAALQDLFVDTIKGLSMWAHRARLAGAKDNAAVNHFVFEGLFSTLTNVNFDAERFQKEFIPKAIELREERRKAYEAACKAKGIKPEALENTPATWRMASTDQDWLVSEGKARGVLVRRMMAGEEVSALQELITYGLKGVAAYGAHALAVLQEDPEVHAGVQEILSNLGTPGGAGADAGSLVGMSMKTGALNLKVLELLDRGHTTRFGNPVPTAVRTTPIEGKAILVSGHDLHDLDQLLQQTEGKGINVYTHGEMLPAHGYPGLHKYKHLAGNYGGAWNLQKFEFPKFPGPIVMTTNCLMEPRKSYAGRIYSANAVGWPDMQHIETSKDGRKDFSAVIEQAQQMPGFTARDIRGPEQTVTTGFGHATILSIADKVIDAVKTGKVKHFFLIGGCDGNESERNYYKELAVATPSDSIILTVGCGKYRFNKLDFGLVPNTPLPRVLDMGQCNDSYGAVVVASALAKAFGTDVNGLPLSFAVSWFEQKAVAVLLTLLHLGVKNIALGPNLPAFITPATGEFLNKTFGLRRAIVDKVDEDLDIFLNRKGVPPPAAKP